jgi:hypothetical protein
MSCAQLSQTVKILVPADETVEIILSFFAAIILAIIFILLLLFYRFRKIIITKVLHC